MRLSIAICDELSASRLDEPSLRAAFALLDRDADGAITRDDLKATIGQACDEAEIDELFSQLHRPAGAPIFFTDFLGLMTRENKRYPHVRKAVASKQIFQPRSLSTNDLFLSSDVSRQKSKGGSVTSVAPSPLRLLRRTWTSPSSRFSLDSKEAKKSRGSSGASGGGKTRGSAYSADSTPSSPIDPPKGKGKGRV